MRGRISKGLCEAVAVSMSGIGCRNSAAETVTCLSLTREKALLVKSRVPLPIGSTHLNHQRRYCPVRSRIRGYYILWRECLSSHEVGMKGTYGCGSFRAAYTG